MLPTIIVDIGSLAWKVQTQFCVGKKEEIIFDNAAGLCGVVTDQTTAKRTLQTNLLIWVKICHYVDAGWFVSCP